MTKLQRTRGLFLSTTILCGAVTAFGQAGCVDNSGLLCGNRPAMISEAPRGMTDGRNSDFALSKNPDEHYGVRVFRDGVLLSPDQYRVEGRSIVFNGNVPVPGDQLLAVYSPSTAAPVTSRAQVMPVGGGGSDLVRAAISEALLREESQASRMQNAPGRGYSEPFAEGSAASGKLPRSLRMLAQAAGEAPAAPEQGRSLSAMGVDGLGDGQSRATVSIDRGGPTTQALRMLDDRGATDSFDGYKNSVRSEKKSNKSKKQSNSAWELAERQSE